MLITLDQDHHDLEQAQTSAKLFFHQVFVAVYTAQLTTNLQDYSTPPEPQLKSFEDVVASGVSVCVQANTAWTEDPFLRQTYPGVQFVEVAGTSSALIAAMRRGECGAVISSSVGAIIETALDCDVGFAKDSMYQEMNCVSGFSYNSPFHFLEPAFSYMYLKYRTDGTFDKLKKKWLNPVSSCSRYAVTK